MILIVVIEEKDLRKTKKMAQFPDVKNEKQARKIIKALHKIIVGKIAWYWLEER